MVKNRRRRDEIEKLDKLPWTPSVTNEDPFAAFAGSDHFEGGFMSLEEIDESEYNFTFHGAGKSTETEKSGTISEKKKQKRTNTEAGKDGKIESGEKMGEGVSVKPKKKKKKKKNKKVEEAHVDEKSGAVSTAKKRKRTNTEGGEDAVEADGEQKIGEEDSVKPKKKRKMKRKRNKKKAGQVQDKVSETKAEEADEFVDEDEFSSWNELRLHPLLMKSIYKLGFKEPTPIQKACIPAAAHQGKDVIGAAETGSGKTLAFGLPILQRLLEEGEKLGKLMIEDGEAANKIAPRGLLRALIITPTRELAIQVTDHLKAAARYTSFHVVSIVGGMSTEKQERLLRGRPEIIVGTPGRLWELMSGGEKHLVELHSLSFFVLDEADRMIENGHFRELQSIIDMLPLPSGAVEDSSGNMPNCVTVSSVQRKKRQTFVFSATIGLSSDFRKKLKRGHLKSTQSGTDDLSSLETLSERAGMRPDAAIVDLTNASIMASNLEESFLECKEEDKDAYLYYILCVHGRGRTIVFCTSIAALRHVSALLRILNVNVWTIHAQMQQRARLKATDRFRDNENGILVATDVFARGLDIPGVRTVIHYQLPHSAEVYVHRSGRTARASTEGCSVALISPKDRSKFASLCRSFSKDTLQRFPVDSAFMPEVLKRLSLARQVDKISRKESQEKARESWIQRSAESIGLDVEGNDSEDEILNRRKQGKATSIQLKKLQQELHVLLSRPLQPKSFSHRFLAGGGISPDLQHQLVQLTQQKLGGDKNKIAIIGQDCVEPLQALRRAGSEVCIDIKKVAEKQRNMEHIRRKRKDAKKRQKEQKRKEKKKRKEACE